MSQNHRLEGFNRVRVLLGFALQPRPVAGTRWVGHHRNAQVEIMAKTAFRAEMEKRLVVSEYDVVD